MGKHAKVKSGNPLRDIEFDRWYALQPTVRVAWHVGRVGALAVALGIGSAAVSMPLVYADTTGSAGSTADASSPSQSSSSASSSSPSSGTDRAVTRGSAVRARARRSAAVTVRFRAAIRRPLRRRPARNPRRPLPAATGPGRPHLWRRQGSVTS